MRLIMTPRADLVKCGLDESIKSAMDGNAGRYSFLPVEDEDERICGLFHAEQWLDSPPSSKSVREVASFEELRENHLIGDSASILDYVATSKEHPTRLVVSGNEIVGMVCPADLHKLPVRAALFTMITALEIAMAHRIQSKWSSSDEWLHLLSPCRRKRVKERIDEAADGDTSVSDIVFTEFADKKTIITKKRLVDDRSNSALKRDFKTIQTLRDNVAHANDYAASKKAAKGVADTVVTIRHLIELLGDEPT